MPRGAVRRLAGGSLGVLLTMAAVTGCSGGSTAPAAAADAPPAPLVPRDSCPSAGPAATEWPLAVPAALPKPPGSQILSTRVVGNATYVMFTTPTSLRESTIYLVTSLRQAGFTLSRGDAEATEADAPFVGPTVVGAIRLTLNQNCLTNWILAVEPRESTGFGGLGTPGGASPTLIPYHPGPSASPLPFG